MSNGLYYLPEISENKINEILIMLIEFDYLIIYGRIKTISKN